MFPRRLPRAGETRSRVAARHALFAPDGFVPNPLPGWRGATGVVLIAPPLALGGGARFAMTLLAAESGAAPGATLPASGLERFVHVLEGELEVAAEARNGTPEGASGGGAAEADLGAGGWAFLPAGRAHRFAGSAELRAVLFEKRWRPFAGGAGPHFVAGDLDAAPALPFEGNERLRVRTLLPAESAFDVAVNVMEFDPGAALPLVETHVNEHGLYMLAGGGIYRLEDAWYPVAAGDAIWMAPHCPQWFGALGDETARYLLYKDVHRDYLDDGGFEDGGFEDGGFEDGGAAP